MRYFQQLVFIAAVIISNSILAQDKPFNAVQNFFSAMSEVNHTKMKSTVTSDFQLLEVGEDWSMEDLVAVIKPSDYRRKNYFNVIRSEVRGDMAWVSYWNKATFSKGESLETVVWLESAVLVKQNNNWKIQMLHSTKIKPENLPKDIMLTEQ